MLCSSESHPVKYGSTGDNTRQDKKSISICSTMDAQSASHVIIALQDKLLIIPFDEHRTYLSSSYCALTPARWLLAA